MPKKTGICINFGGCAKAKAKEQQEAEVTNFVCEECEKPLREVRSKPTGPNKKLIAIIAAVVLLVCVVVLLLTSRGGGGTATPGGGGDPIVVKPVKDTTQTNGGEDSNPKPKTNPNDLGWAVYDGPMNNGKPHGSGGTLTVKKDYSIDLKDANGTKVDVEKGDKIVSTIFKNGKFTYGELHRKNGERKPLNIGN